MTRWLGLSKHFRTVIFRIRNPALGDTDNSVADITALDVHYQLSVTYTTIPLCHFLSFAVQTLQQLVSFETSFFVRENSQCYGSEFWIWILFSNSCSYR